MKAGKYKSLKLQHGASIREFDNVVMRHPVHTSLKRQGEEMKDRWELEGTELKVEANPGGRSRIVKVPVTVGFLPDDVITD